MLARAAEASVARMLQVDEEPTRVRLHDDRLALEVSCPGEGTLRIRHAPASRLSSVAHPRLPPKRSWAVVGEDPKPLKTSRAGATLRVEAPGCALQLSLQDGQWRFLDDGGVERAASVSLRSDEKDGYPVPHWRSALTLRAPPKEAYAGFGEKLAPTNRRGRRFTFWNTDVLPHLEDSDPLYVSIPFFIALRDGQAWGMFVDESWRSEVDVARANDDALEWIVNGPEVDAYLFTGPSPKDVLRRYTALTGRMALPPLWSLGAHQSRWGYESEEDVLEVARAYRRHGLPLDAVHLDIDHQRGFEPFVFDRSRFADPVGLIRKLKEEGARLVTIVDPAIPARPGNSDYDAAVEQDLLVRSDRGEVLLGTVWPDPCAWPDFTREQVRDWWAERHAVLLRAGLGGVWNDMNEPSAFEVHTTDKDLTPPTVPRGLPSTCEGKTLPYDARHGARRHIEVHNVYGLAMSQAAHAAFRRHAPDRRPFVLTRAAFAGIQRCAAVWTGDNSSHWSHLERSIPLLSGLGLCGVPFVGSDVPGFLARATPELLVRWMEVGIFYPLMRNHSARGTPPKEPWRFGEPYLTHARRALQARYRLLPALYTLFAEHARCGLPPLRALPLEFPGDDEALRADDQLMFGGALLVAPIVREGQTRRLVWLPQGSWVPLFDLVPPAERCVLEGGVHLIAHAPLGHTPIYLRGGSGVALTEPAARTTTANFETIDWHLHTAATFGADLHEDEGDGDGPHLHTQLAGTCDGATMLLVRSATGALASARRVERLHLYGLTGTAAQVEGATVLQQGAALVLEVPPGWTQIRVQLA